MSNESEAVVLQQKREMQSRCRRLWLTPSMSTSTKDVTVEPGDGQEPALPANLVARCVACGWRVEIACLRPSLARSSKATSIVINVLILHSLCRTLRFCQLLGRHTNTDRAWPLQVPRLLPHGSVSVESASRHEAGSSQQRPARVRLAYHYTLLTLKPFESGGTVIEQARRLACG
jgi:hypothetical protein